ncbi:MAG: bis(5'-nucleosyl)-tetraphosphatase (symmetrical) YqeK [Firmicutes bacterium]|nr:bis(5'-nucleosyl)-tetraphosphatase (symmetrical) YqeK [Bacillota bacterium]
MRTLVFGGTFDPVHIGHTGLLSAISAGFDRALIVPNGNPPHKERATASYHRVNMCRLAFPGLQICEYEVEKEGPSYTYETLEYLQGRGYGELFYLVGADSLKNIFGWREPERIAALCTLAVVKRPFCNAGLEETAGRYRRELGGRVEIFTYPSVEASSTEARLLNAFGEAHNILPAAVAEYAAAHGLYRDYCCITDRYRAYSLDAERIEHIKQTALTALRLARMYGGDEPRAVTAALLHDIAKETVKTGQYDFTVPPGCPFKVAHSYAGGYVAEQEFGITDRDILNAVTYHTSGRPGMSTLEKIVYIADYIEPGREFADIDAIRSAAYTDLDAGTLAVLRNSVFYLREKNRDIYPLTLDALEYYSK